MLVNFLTAEGANLKQYSKIPWGWLKMLLGILNLLVLEVAAFFLTINLLKWAGNATLGPMLLLPMLGIMLGILGYFMFGARWMWVQSYFERNLRGYVVRFFVPQDGRSHWHCQIVTSVNDLSPKTALQPPDGGFVIEVSLGGWFRWQASRILKDGKIIFPDAHHWDVELHEIRETDAVYVVLRWYDDNKTESLVLEVGDALRVIDYAYAPAMGLSETLLALMHEKEACVVQARHLVDAKTAVSDVLTGVRAQRDDLVRTLELLADVIAQTNRLKTTIEGLTLQVQVLAKLAEVHADDSTAFARIKGVLETARIQLDAMLLRQRRTRRVRTVGG